MKKNLKVLLTVVFLSLVCFFVIDNTSDTQAAVRNGWVTVSGKTYTMKMVDLIKAG